MTGLVLHLFTASQLEAQPLLPGKAKTAQSRAVPAELGGRTDVPGSPAPGSNAGRTLGTAGTQSAWVQRAERPPSGSIPCTRSAQLLSSEKLYRTPTAVVTLLLGEAACSCAAEPCSSTVPEWTRSKTQSTEFNIHPLEMCLVPQLNTPKPPGDLTRGLVRS